MGHWVHCPSVRNGLILAHGPLKGITERGICELNNVRESLGKKELFLIYAVYPMQMVVLCIFFFFSYWCNIFLWIHVNTKSFTVVFYRVFTMWWLLNYSSWYCNWIWIGNETRCIKWVPRFLRMHRSSQESNHTSQCFTDTAQQGPIHNNSPRVENWDNT